jgi:hypothetical protein
MVAVGNIEYDNYILLSRIPRGHFTWLLKAVLSRSYHSYLPKVDCTLISAVGIRCVAFVRLWFYIPHIGSSHRYLLEWEVAPPLCCGERPCWYHVATIIASGIRQRNAEKRVDSLMHTVSLESNHKLDWSEDYWRRC